MRKKEIQTLIDSIKSMVRLNKRELKELNPNKDDYARGMREGGIIAYDYCIDNLERLIGKKILYLD